MAANSAPFSIRLSAEEREMLERAAAGLPLGTYIRSRILDNVPIPQRPRAAAVADQSALARVLGQLGQARLANNLNQLAKAANMGVLVVTPEVTAELSEACVDVRTMWSNLMRALGLQEPVPR